MAKAIVLMPPAELEQRDSDVSIPAERFLKFSLFARLAKKPTVERFPGTLVLRRFRQGEVICRQGESGWTAFYLLTAEDMLELRNEQLQAARGRGNLRNLQEEIDELEDRLADQQIDPDDRSLKAAAVVYLASARRALPGMGGWLETLSQSVLPSPTRTPDRKPLYIPIDAPTDVSYDSRQAFLHEGDLFGEQSCLYGTPRSATIVADCDCYVLEMLRNILDQIQADKIYRAEMDAIYKQRILKDQLRNLSLFSVLTEEQFNQIRDSVDLIRYKDGQLIYDEHDRPDGMFVIRSGLVKIMRNVSSLLVEEDVLDWAKLKGFLRGDASANPAAVKYLHSLLPERIRGTTAEVPAGEVIAELNEIIKNRKHSKDPKLRELISPILSAFVQELPAKPDDWSELDCRRYNRLLLEAACPGTFRKRQRPSGPETVIAYCGRGEIIGEMGVMDRQPRTATCVAYVHPRPEGPGPDGGKWRREVEHVELVKISEQTFRQLIESTPSLRRKMERLIAQRRRNDTRLQVRATDDGAEGLLSGRAAELGLIQGQKMMLIDLDRCTRCDECVQACVNTHEDGRTRLFLDGPRFGKFLVPTTCRACLDPVCMIGCPVGSIHRGDNRQIVIEDWCIGCGLCATNCPYGSIQMHDVGIIPGSTHGWRFAPEKWAGQGWQRPRFNDRQWLDGQSPFADDRELRDKLETLGFRSEHAVCFRYTFRVERRVVESAVGYKLEVTSADDGATVWINGQELAKPAEKPKRGKREYVLALGMKLLRRGRNVVAVRMVPPPYALGKKLPLLDLRMDEIREPDVPVDLSASVEISEKVVTELAVVCDQCSSQFGQRPACVTACPHDAAMRVDARFNFPVA